MPIEIQQTLLNYLKNRGLGFIKSEAVFEKIPETDIPKLLAAMQEVDRNYSVDIYNKRSVTPIAKETLDFLEKHRFNNAVAGYYYHSYTTTQPQTWDQTNSSRFSLENLADKNLAAYFLLAEITMYRLNDKEKAAVYCKKGLEKLAEYLQPSSGKEVVNLWNAKKFEWNVYGADNFNRHVFRPLQFFVGKTDPKYFKTKYTVDLLTDNDQKNLISITGALISRQKEGPGGSSIFHNFLYNATMNALEFLQEQTSFLVYTTNSFKFSLSFVRLFSHPVFGNELLEKIKNFKLQNKSSDPEKALSELLEKINQRSDQLLSLFDKSPQVIQSKSLENIANLPIEQLSSQKTEESKSDSDDEAEAPASLMWRFQ